MQGVVGGTVEVVELPCGDPQAAVSYTAAEGRIARIPQWSGIRRSFSTPAVEVVTSSGASRRESEEGSVCRVR